MTIKVLTRAYRDIADIWNFIAADNPAAADEHEEHLFDAIAKLVTQPGLGHRRGDVKDDRYRFWRVGSYLIAYRVHGNQLTICRVVHSARDFRRIF